ncbi:MAG: baseplate J/gp47 family protein [Cystobacter sp.]
MSLTLTQLLEIRDKEVLLAQLLTALQGVGFVHKEGLGSGAVQASGVAASTYNVALKVTTAGELGTAYFTVSTDGGVTYGSAILVPVNGVYVVGTTGATVTFYEGPEGADTSFQVGDVYSFSLAVPTFPTAAWQPGSTALTTLELDAEAMEDFSIAQLKVAAGGLLEYASGAWLDLLGEQVYQLTRQQPVAAVGNVVLTDSASAGPFNITANQLWVGTPGGLRFNTQAGGTLPLGSNVTLQVKAESPGAVYSVGANTITALLTALPGVTVNNPNPMGGSWLTTPGADRETDANYKKRCRERWPALGIGAPEDAYKSWAKTAGEGAVTQVYPRASPTSPGTVDAFLAGPLGPVDPVVVTKVQTYLNKRASFGTVPLAASATAYPYTVSGTLTVKAGYAAAAAADIAQNLGALNAGGVSTSGEALEGWGIGGTIIRAQIVEQLMAARGAINLNLGTLLPAADIAMTVPQVGVLTISITISEV